MRWAAGYKVKILPHFTDRLEERGGGKVTPEYLAGCLASAVRTGKRFAAGGVKITFWTGGERWTGVMVPATWGWLAVTCYPAEESRAG